MTAQHLHIDYTPQNGWVLTIMSRLLKSSDPDLRKAFERWSDTPLMELGFAITTRMHMLGLCIRRLNNRVAQLREELKSDIPKIEDALARQGAFTPKDKDLPYELLLDMDSFIFETRPLYEIVGKFLVELFRTLFGRKVTQGDLQSILSSNGIDTRWIAELQENRKLFFHQTAPWVAIEVESGTVKFDPILLKRNVTTFEDPDSFVSFTQLRDIYDGFIGSASELHRFVMEQIRLHESNVRVNSIN
jgi:hypothetical protein